MAPWLLPLFVVQAMLFVASAYLALLTVAGLAHRGRKGSERLSSGLRLAVLVPAHNEETHLPRLLESLRRNDYPQELYDVHVVADNCEDGTADVARGYGVHVHERRDAERIGKGYALEWLLQRVRESAAYDGYVFLDADCEVTPNFLSVIAQRLAEGQPALQAYYTAADPFVTPVSSLRYAALVLKHRVRPQGRQVLGLPCGLFGTGMAFSKEVIDRFGWSAFTLAEDIEYQLRLAEHGIYVAYVGEATVLSEMPRTLSQARSQNIRWERGRLRLVLQWGPRLLAGAVRERSWKKVDILMEQAIPPLSVLVALSGVQLAASALLRGNRWHLPLSVASFAALAVHVIGGLVLARTPRQAYKALAFAPLFVLWKLFVYAVALLPGRSRWVRTERS